MGADRHPLGGAIHFDADKGEADEIESKDEKRLNLGGRESHFLRSGGHGRRTARCVLARKWPRARGIDGNALQAAGLAEFLLRLLGPASALDAPAGRARIGPDHSGPIGRKRQTSLVRSGTPTRHELADAHARRHEHRQSDQYGEQHSQHKRRMASLSPRIG